MEQSSASTLRPMRRVVTTNSPNGESVFVSSLSDIPPRKDILGGCGISFCYGSFSAPADFDGDRDVEACANYDDTPPNTMKTGSVARLVDFPPGYTSPMHRTISLNYNFVVEGEVEIILDSGETRILQRGDMAVQRAVNHAWRNTSSTSWARITAISLPADMPEILREKS